MRLAVTVLLLTLLAFQVDWETAARRVREGDPAWLLAAILAVFLGLLLGAARGTRCCGRPGSRPPRHGGARLLHGRLREQLPPDGLGGDAVRALAVAPPGPLLARAATTVIADRLTALACLLALGWIALPYDPAAVPDELVATLAVVTAAAVMGAALVALAARSRATRARIPARARPLLAEMWAPLRTLAGDRRLIARVMALGLGYQWLILLSVWCAARSIELELSSR